MKFNNYDVCVITDEKQRLYLLGFHSTAGHVILTKEKTVFVVDRRYYYAANEKLCKSGIEVVCGSDYTYLKELVYQKEYERNGAFIFR